MAKKTKTTFTVVTTSAVEHEFNGTVKLVDDHIEVDSDDEWREWFDNFMTNDTAYGDVLRFHSADFDGDVTVMDEDSIQNK